jgi:hypothetical protein
MDNKGREDGTSTAATSGCEGVGVEYEDEVGSCEDGVDGKAMESMGVPVIEPIEEDTGKSVND